jgi:hypothetical protein
MKKVKKKKTLTKAEKVVNKMNDYMNEHFSYEIVKGDIGDTVINVLNKVRLQNNHWTTAKGKQLAIDEISDDHLDNILKHLEERAKIQAVKESVEKELDDIMYQWRKNLPIIYNLLRVERDRREEAKIQAEVMYLNCRCTLLLDDEVLGEVDVEVKQA